MNALQQMFSSAGFRVLGFPCNNFNMLEPGDTGVEIMNGVRWVRPGGGFLPTFDMFKKIDVNGNKEDPIYTFLKGQCPPTSDEYKDGLFYDPKTVSDVRWNFEVFLTNKQGRPVYRYSPDSAVSPDIEAGVRELINMPIVSNDSREEFKYEEVPEKYEEVAEKYEEVPEESFNLLP